MRSITPVIAIVVLLLMTISAGGLAYLTITGYQEEAVRGGMAGVEQTFETMAEQVKVESIADGKMIVRNTGSRSIDDFSPLVLVDGIPVQAISSKGSLAVGETAVVELRISTPVSQTVVDLTTPSGNSVTVTHTGKCTTVGITNPGQSTVHQSAQCYSLMSFVPCVVDGVCDVGGAENEFNCQADCGLSMWAGDVELEGVGSGEVYIFTYNQTMDILRNLTESPTRDEVGSKGVYDSDSDFMATWVYDVMGPNNVQYRFWNKSDWSPVGNVTQDYEGTINTELGPDRDGNIMLVFQDAYNTIGSSVWNGTGWSPVVNATILPEDVGRLHKQPDMGLSGNSLIVVWNSYIVGPAHDWYRSAVWNGTGWDHHSNVTSEGAGRVGVVTARSGPTTAVFGEPVYGGYQVHSADWNGTGWSNYLNVSGIISTYPGGMDVARDAGGRDVAVYVAPDGESGPTTTFWSVRQGNTWSTPQIIGGEVAGGMMVLYDNLPGGIMVAWAEDKDTYTEFLVSPWNAFSQTFGTPQPLLNCTPACRLV